jgi:hypothetical protein
MPGWDLRAELHIGAVFARVNQLMGLNWSEEFDSRLWQWIGKPHGDLASLEELRCSIVKISPTVRSTFTLLTPISGVSGLSLLT